MAGKVGFSLWKNGSRLVFRALVALAVVLLLSGVGMVIWGCRMYYQYQQYLKAREEEKYLISPEDIATYREVEPFIFVPSSSIFANISTDGGQLHQRYMDGHISSDQFIKEFNRILRMMQMEDM